jgi:RNA polymerase sigma-70 factor (ECF subfamily)
VAITRVELFERARSGSARAEGALYERYAPRLRAYYAKQGVDYHSLHDATQETFARFLHALREGRIRPSCVEGWLFATARNVFVDMLRKRSRLPLTRLPATLAAFDSRPDKLAEAKDQRRAILRTLRDIPVSLRAPMCLRAYRGLSYREIAERMDISENAVGVRIHRARRLLRDLLDT